MSSKIEKAAVLRPSRDGDIPRQQISLHDQCQLIGDQPNSQAQEVQVLPPPYSSTETFSQEIEDEKRATIPALPHPAPPQLPAHLQPSLSKPVAVPSTTSELGSPFLRAYPPELEGLGISRDSFLEFLDHLNRVTVASPPLLVLNAAGGIVGLVPEPTAQIVSESVDLATDVATYALSKGRTELLLRKANRELFGPIGLRADVAKLNAVAKAANIPILDDKGKILKGIPLLPPHPLAKEDGNSSSSSSSSNGLDVDLLSVNAQARRVKALESWTSPLVIEEKIGQDTKGLDNAFSKMHAMTSEWQRKEEVKKLAKDRQKALDRRVKERAKAEKHYEEKMSSLQKKEAKLLEKIKPEKENEDAVKELGKVSEKREKAAEAYEKEVSKTERKYEVEDKEEKKFRQVCFLLIRKDDGQSSRWDFLSSGS